MDVQLFRSKVHMSFSNTCVGHSLFVAIEIAYLLIYFSILHAKVSKRSEKNGELALYKPGVFKLSCSSTPFSILKTQQSTE